MSTGAVGLLRFGPLAPADELVGVEDLDDAGVLAALVAAEERGRAAERDKLRLGLVWCAAHPATVDTGVASWGPGGVAGVGEESLGGEGTPAVAGLVVEPFAAALGVSTQAGMQVLADGLDLVYRLPGLWARVESLEVPAWRARRVAQLTRRLSRTAAGYVDQRLAGPACRLGPAAVDRAVAEAVARFHPEMLAERERRGRQGWDVRVDHETDLAGFAGTSYLSASGDTMDLSRFYERVCRIAAELGRAGDTDPLGARKAKALGILAGQPLPDEPGEPDTADPDAADPGEPDPDAADPEPGEPGPGHRDDAGAAGAAGEPSVPAGDPSARVPWERPRPARVGLYLHLSLADLLGLAEAEGVLVGSVERLGPATEEAIRRWVGHSRVHITPVLDLARATGLDQYQPPEWMREQVIVRDGHCVFPWCARDARCCDLDHIDPYRPNGPPGQTRPGNLAPLCRRHHRGKTHRRWTYRRAHDGSYLWTSPHGHQYLVHPTDGTTRLDPDE